MSRLAYIPLPFAVGVAAARTLTALFPFLVASGLASLSGAGGEPLDPSRGAGEDAWLWLGLSAAWNLGMALTLVGAAIALLVRHPAARGAAWTWVAVASGETLLRVALLVASPWLGADASAATTGATAIDDVCCCVPVTAIWTIGFAGWLVATRDPLDHGSLATDPDPCPAEGEVDLEPDHDDDAPSDCPRPTQRPVPPYAEPRPNYDLLDEAAHWFDRPTSTRLDA